MPEAKFRRTERLSGKVAFQHLFKEGKTVRGDWFNLIISPNWMGKRRFSCTVRRGVTTTSVVRHKVKRLVREVFRRTKELFPAGMDLLVIVVRIPAKLTYKWTEEEILKLLKIIKL